MFKGHIKEFNFGTRVGTWKWSICETYTLGLENTPRCLIGHINTTNNKMNEPFSTPEITIITEIINKLMYDLLQSSVSLVITLPM